MALDDAPEARWIATRLTTTRSPADLQRIAEIERHREYLASGDAASRHGVPLQRMDELARVASKGPRWASLIFDLVVALEPTRVLEMGTAVGISGAYVAAALEANGFGALVTVEGNARNYEIACETFAALGLDHRVTVVKGKFGEVIDDVIDSEPRFDLVFKDGDHSEAATVEWFDSLAPRLAPTSSFLLDDIRRDAGMKSAWNQVKRRGRVAASVDFFGMGLVLLKPPPHAESRHYRYGIR